MKIFKSSGLTILLATSFITIVSAVLLFYNLGQQPPTLYNWESYTVWKILDEQFLTQPKINHFQITDGLMTDSGISPVMYYPVRFLTSRFGSSLLMLRVWPAFLALCGVVMFFLFISKVFKPKLALISTLLLSSSQAFLLYGRTATIVGPTIVAEVATVIVLYYGLLFKPSVKLLILAIFLLVSNTYFYAPLRFFSPLIVFVILRQLVLLLNQVLEKFRKSSSKIHNNVPWLWLGTILVIATCFVLLHKPVFRYYNARGEQMVTMAVEKHLTLETSQVLTDQFKRNFIRFGQLLLAINTRPASIDFSSLGQLVSRWLSPFFSSE